MRATLMYGAGDVRVEEVPDPVLREPTDAVVRVVRTCICGSDLHPYHNMPASEHGTPMGHEFLGVIEDLGTDVTGLKEGDLVTLADVYGAGYHAAIRANVGPRTTVTVIGDGAVGLLAVLSAKQLGAERITLMGRHKDRTDLGREFGATDVVAERGEEGIAQVRELTGGDGAHAVLEAVGYKEAYEQALGVVRAGGVISRVGVPQYDEAPIGFASLFGANLTLTGGSAPVRAYIDQLLPDILNGNVNPGKVFDRTISLDEVPDGYRAMDRREAIKVLVRL